MTRRGFGDLSTSERKVARALLSTYPVAGLETVAQLAVRANVSPPTVVRFVARLGFSGYPAFQQALMHEVDERMGSPLEQYDAQDQQRAGQALLPYAASTFIGVLNSTFAELPETEFIRAVEAICDRQKRVFLMGGRFSRVLTDYLAAHLQLLRAGVTRLPDQEPAQLSVLVDAGKSDLLLVMDYRRYDPVNVRFAELMAERGSTVLLLTDRWLSPIADVAGIVLPARVEAPSPFDSLVPAMAVVESLVAAVTERLGDGGRKRLKAIEGVQEQWLRQ
jgi:DNA-binding MurR/RpiR family transcriptional regulator